MIKNLQILRFIAALLVVLHHARPPLVHGDFFPQLGTALTFLSHAGFFGVDIFFVISGAIMAHSTLNLDRGWRPAATFTMARFARIYAGWWPFFLLYLLLNWFTGSLQGKDLLRSFFLTQQGLHEMLLPVTWTLTFELFFYCMLGAILLAPKRWTQPLLLAWAGVTVLMLMRYINAGMYTPQRFPETKITHQFLFCALVLEFIAGFFLYHFLRKHPATSVWAWVAIVAIGAVEALSLQTRGNLVHPSGLAGYFYGPERVIFMGAAACGVVALAMRLPEATGVLARAAARLGDASYAIYLCHIGVLIALAPVIAHAGIPVQFRALVFVGLIAAILLYGLLHHRWIERPLYQWMRRRIPRLQPVADPAVHA